MRTQTTDVGGVEMIFGTPNNATKWRVDTLAKKEPDTLAWIDGFDDDDTLMDIGANGGMYTI